MNAVGIVKCETLPAHLTACVSFRDRPYLPSPADLTACRRCQVVSDLAELIVLEFDLARLFTIHTCGAHPWKHLVVQGQPA